jgi:hypothetical protein
MNVVILYGRLTRDPEIRYSPNGNAVLRTSVAVDRAMSRQKKEEAQRNNQPTADFISCVAFGNTAELISNYFRKGSRIALEGRIQTGSYDKQDGTKVYTTDVVINRVHFVESASESQNGGQYVRRPQVNQGSNFDNPPVNSAYEDSSFNSDDNTDGFYPVGNEDIPF